jgi:DNA-binding transcriptional MerR regulator
MGSKQLSEIQRESIISLRARGYTAKQVAAMLDMNPNTCHTVYWRYQDRLQRSKPEVQSENIDWEKKWVELQIENVRLKDDLDILKTLIRRTFADKV